MWSIHCLPVLADVTQAVYVLFLLPRTASVSISKMCNPLIARSISDSRICTISVRISLYHKPSRMDTFIEIPSTHSQIFSFVMNYVLKYHPSVFVCIFFLLSSLIISSSRSGTKPRTAFTALSTPSTMHGMLFLTYIPWIKK